MSCLFKMWGETFIKGGKNGRKNFHNKKGGVKERRYAKRDNV